jgi:hypothetical protein
MIISAQESSLWRRIRKVIPASSTLSVESLPLTRFRSTKYLIEVYNTVENKFKAIEFWAVRKGSGDVNSTVYGVLGDNIQIELNLDVSVADAVLSLVNLETFDLNVIITRSNS